MAPKPRKSRATSSSTPTKKASQNSQADTPIIDQEITQSDILNANSSEEIIALISRLTSTSQDKLFAEYRSKAELQLEEQARRIEELENELEAKQQIIQAQNEVAKNAHAPASKSSSSSSGAVSSFISPIKKKGHSEVLSQDELGKELETIGITFDMLELLTGLRITNYEEDHHRFHFDVVQMSTNGQEKPLTVQYRLIIEKKLHSSADINYIPTFMKEKTANADVLTKILPEYFCDNLTFPYNTLSQFYTKINRALNKGAKGLEN